MNKINECCTFVEIRYRVVTLIKGEDSIHITTVQFRDIDIAKSIASNYKKMIHRGVISSEVYPLVSISDNSGYLIIYRGFYIRENETNNSGAIYTVNTTYEPSIYHNSFNDILEAIDYIDKTLLNKEYGDNNE